MLKERKDTPKSIYFDIKAEVLASRLIGSEWEGDELSLENILMTPAGDHKRRSARDVLDVRSKYFESETVLQFNLNRKGFYDNLPPYLFHKLDSKHDSAKKRTQELKRQEQEARKFFLPFEQATYIPRIEIELFEQKCFDTFPDFIKEIWGLNRFNEILSQKQEYLFCHLLPEAYRVVGDWELTQLIFEAALGKPVELTFRDPEEIPFENDKSMGSDLRLGEDSILGTTFKDEFLLLEIAVKGITRPDLEEYMPLGNTRKIIDEILCSYFIPLDVPYRLELVTTEDSQGFELGQVTLGYNTMISST